MREEGAERCPGPAHPARRVTERLGYDPFSEDSARAVEAVLRREQERWTAAVTLRNVNGRSAGTKRFESRSQGCEAIADVASLSIAFAIELSSGEEKEDAAAPSPAPQVARVEHPPRPASAPPIRTSGNAVAAIRALPGWGLLPGVPLSVATEARVSVGAAQILLGTLWIPFARAPDPDFRFSLMAVGGGPCLDVERRSWLRLAGCAQFLAGAAYTLVRGRPALDTAPEPWIAVSIGERLSLRVTRWLFVEIGLDAVVPLQRPEFYVENSDRLIYRPSPVVFLPSVGIGLHVL